MFTDGTHGPCLRPPSCLRPPATPLARDRLRAAAPAVQVLFSIRRSGPRIELWVRARNPDLVPAAAVVQAVELTRFPPVPPRRLCSHPLRIEFSTVEPSRDLKSCVNSQLPKGSCQFTGKNLRISFRILEEVELCFPSSRSLPVCL